MIGDRLKLMMLQQVLDGNGWEAPDAMQVEQAKADSLSVSSQCSRRTECNDGVTFFETLTGDGYKSSR